MRSSFKTRLDLWYDKASKHGYAKAHKSLVKFYREGIATEKDISRASELMKLANEK